jgi:hypothetical protein
MMAASACSPSEPLRVDTIQLGRSLNSDNSVGIHTTRFGPHDTIYLSLLSEEPGYGTITVRWILNGLVVNESSRDVSYNGPGATVFSPAEFGGIPGRHLPGGDPAGRSAPGHSKFPRRVAGRGALIRASRVRDPA